MTAKLTTALVAVFLCVLALAMLTSRGAYAHDWYDSACCHDKDCEELPDSAVTIEADGYRVQYIGIQGLHVNVLVPFNQAKPSRDAHYHGCATSDRFLCLYVPTSS